MAASDRLPPRSSLTLVGSVGIAVVLGIAAAVWMSGTRDDQDATGPHAPSTQSAPGATGAPVTPRSDAPLPSGGTAAAHHRLFGRALDVFGAPVTQCEIACETEGAAYSRRSAADGRFELQIPAGARNALAILSHPDFPPTVIWRAAGPLRGGETDLGTLRITSGRSTNIAVVDAERGTAIRGARIRVAPLLVSEHAPTTWPAHQTQTLFTDARGHAAIRALPRGSYRASVDADEYASRSVTFRYPPELDASGSSVPGASGRLTIALPPGVVIRGRVVSAEGLPIPDAAVLAFPLDAARPTMPPRAGAEASIAAVAASSRTADSGDFRVTRLAAGTYVLVVDTPAHGSTELGPVEVPPRTPLIVRMPERTTITGRVTGVGAEPTAGARVEIRPLEGTGTATWMASTDATGEFSIPSVPAGRIEASVSSEAGPIRSLRIETEPSLGTTELRLGQPHPTLTGRLLDGSGQVVNGATIRIMPPTTVTPPEPALRPAQTPAKSVSGSDGRFTLSGRVALSTAGSVGPGKPRRAASDAATVRLEVTFATGAVWLSGPVPVRAATAANSLDLGDIEVSDAGEVRAEVLVGTDRYPAAGVTVYLSPFPPTPPGAATQPAPARHALAARTDAFGRVRFNAVPAGRWTLTTTLDPASLTPSPAARTEPFEVTDRHRHSVTLTLPR